MSSKYLIVIQRICPHNHSPISSASWMFIWAKYYSGCSPGQPLSLFRYTDPTIREDRTSACDADVHSLRVPGVDGQGIAFLLTSLLPCKQHASPETTLVWERCSILLKLSVWNFWEIVEVAVFLQMVFLLVIQQETFFFFFTPVIMYETYSWQIQYIKYFK